MAVPRSEAASARRGTALRWLAVAVLAALFLTMYLFFDLREGGRNQTVLSHRLTNLGSIQERYGTWFVAGMLVLDVLLAVGAAMLLVRSYQAIRARRHGGTEACSVGASTLIGFGLFACPSCPIPILGTLGVAFWATSLPLYGLEFKLLALALTAGTFVWLRRRERPKSAVKALA